MCPCLSSLRLLTGLLCLAGFAASGQTISSIFNNSPGLGGLTWIGLAGDQVTIQGNSFTTVSEVRFNGVLSPSAGGGTSTAFSAVVPAGAANSTNFVTVKFANGTTITSPQRFIVPPSGPYVRSFADFKGGAGERITLTGTRFTGVTSVQFKGSSGNLTGLNLFKAGDTSMLVDAPPGVVTGPITVVSNAFTHVTTSNFFAAPGIASFTPASGRAGTNVTLYGSNFLGATAVFFGALPAAHYDVLSTTQLVATVPNNAVSAKISISTPAATAFTTNSFKVLPTLIGFNPIFGPVGTPVTITGTNLNEGSGAGGAPQVFFNGIASTTVSNVSFNQLTAVVPNGATTGKISVTTTNGSGTNDSLFHLPAIITSITPNTNPPGSRVRIDGTNFLDATAVIFANNIPSPNFTVTNNNIIGAEVPGGITTGNIKVVTPAGTNTSVATYFAAPQVSSFNPLSGLPGDFVSVFGNNLGGATAVRFSAPGGFVNATIFSQPPGRIDVTVPSGAMTGPISVVGPAGIGSSPTNFTLNYSSLQITVTNTPNPAQVGLPVTYSIQVKNLGPNAATVLVTNILPASVAFSSSTAGTTVGGTTAVNLGSVGVNATAGFSVTGIPSVAAMFVTNATTASAGPLPAYAATHTIHFVEPPALLRAEFYPPTSLLLSWPTMLSNYGLEFRTNLSLGNWSPVPTPPTANNGTNTVTDQMASPERFYRLKR